MSPNYWLMKAEPDTRIVKDKDVKFSVDDFESTKTTAWEGVRNHEAKNLMKSMRIGDQVLFYHSNCKNPGIAGFAEVSKEAYPDYSAWDPKHPYYDPKTDQNDPKWYMVDLTFKHRAKHFLPLYLLRHIASLPDDEPPSEIEYIGEEGIKSIKGMALVTRGRLSVQKVDEKTWNIITLLADKGGWNDMEMGRNKGKSKAVGDKKKKKTAANPKDSGSQKNPDNQTDEDKADTSDNNLREETKEEEAKARSLGAGRKRKAVDHGDDVALPSRRSTRTKK